MTIVLLSLGFFSCAQEKTLSVLFQGIDENRIITSTSKESFPESIILSKSKKLLYHLDNPVSVPSGYSLEITYSFSFSDSADFAETEQSLTDWKNNSGVEITFSNSTDSWILPISLREIGIQPRETFAQAISYVIPLPQGMFNSFSIEVENNHSLFAREKNYLNLQSFKLVPQWFGLVNEKDNLKITPFVYLKDTDASETVTINPPPKFQIYHPELNVPQFESISDNPIEVTGKKIDFVVLQSAQNRAFPLNPINLIPGEILSFDKSLWRKESYEVFRWNQFPSILIFDTASYDVQDRLVKRLAFFVEKAGFQGTLSTDEEIAHLHGWNAHDYRAEDLARFFETARITNFLLNDEELELKAILLEQNIIVQKDDSSIIPGVGAIVSISRESADYLRNLFMVHEYYHGLYFIDKDFEEFARFRWKNLDSAAKVFITEYFASQRYDTNNEYLMANELMAYCLQQPVSMAADYFGKNLAGRIYANPARNHVLPERDDDLSYPLLAERFTQEAEAFSNYVTKRWGLRAGTLRIR
jgi:hypothetical protein